MADYINKIRTTEGDKPVNYEALANKPNSLPNPNKIKFTGSVVAEYDGSSEVTVNIPNGASEEQAAQIQTNTNDISELKNKTSELNSDLAQLLLLPIIWHDGYYISSVDGTISSNSSFTYAEVDVSQYACQYISFIGFDTYGVLKYVYCDSEGNVIDGSNASNKTFYKQIPYNATTLRVSIYISKKEYEIISVCRTNAIFSSIERISKKVDKITENFDKFIICNNLFSDKEIKYGYYQNGDNLQSNSNYNVIVGIPVEAGKTYIFSPKIRFISIYDTNENYQYTMDTDTGEEYSITFIYDSILNVTVYASSMDSVKMYDSVNTEIESMNSPIIKDNVKFPRIENAISNGFGNILYGKKWVACGDSFTEGVITDVFEDEPYINKKKVYPYFIGRRNGMNVINEAVSGSTMAVNSSGLNGAFADNRYKNIASDADYITLYFGINDDNYNTPIGNIDDTDKTTFYGAWNTVLEYLITNHPYAKIGIIITNGSSLQYTTAERAVARRWGIPYLDMEADYQHVPLMQRVTERSEVCQKALDLRKTAFSVSQYNTHPNAKAHEYESTFIENWLRSL